MNKTVIQVDAARSSETLVSCCNTTWHHNLGEFVL